MNRNKIIEKLRNQQKQQEISNINRLKEKVAKPKIKKTESVSLEPITDIDFSKPIVEKDTELQRENDTSVVKVTRRMFQDGRGSVASLENFKGNCNYCNSVMSEENYAGICNLGKCTLKICTGCAKSLEQEEGKFYCPTHYNYKRNQIILHKAFQGLGIAVLGIGKAILRFISLFWERNDTWTNDGKSNSTKKPKI